MLRDFESFEAQVEALKRKQAGCAKERLLQERKVKKLQGEKDKKVGCCLGNVWAMLVMVQCGPCCCGAGGGRARWCTAGCATV